MATNLINLDLIKAPSQKIKFLEKEFEIGYIPCGLSVPLLEEHNRQLKEQKETDEVENIIDDMLTATSIFCSFYYPEFTKDYLKINATSDMLNTFYQHLITAIVVNFTTASPGQKGEESDPKKKAIGEN